MQAPPSYYESVKVASPSVAASATPNASIPNADLDNLPIDSPFIKQDDVDLMMSMGFKKSHCQVALIRNSGNVNDAISMVLENNESAMTSFVREYRNNQRFLAGPQETGSRNNRALGSPQGPAIVISPVTKPSKKGWSLFGMFKSDKKSSSSLNVSPAHASSSISGEVSASHSEDTVADYFSSAVDYDGAPDKSDKTIDLVHSPSHSYDLPPPEYDGPPPTYDPNSDIPLPKTVPIFVLEDTDSSNNINNSSSTNTNTNTDPASTENNNSINPLKSDENLPSIVSETPRIPPLRPKRPDKKNKPTNPIQITALDDNILVNGLSASSNGREDIGVVAVENSCSSASDGSQDVSYNNNNNNSNNISNNISYDCNNNERNFPTNNANNNSDPTSTNPFDNEDIFTYNNTAANKPESEANDSFSNNLSEFLSNGVNNITIASNHAEGLDNNTFGTNTVEVNHRDENDDEGSDFGVENVTAFDEDPISSTQTGHVAGDIGGDVNGGSTINNNDNDNDNDNASFADHLAAISSTSTVEPETLISSIEAESVNGSDVESNDNVNISASPLTSKEKLLARAKKNAEARIRPIDVPISAESNSGKLLFPSIDHIYSTKNENDEDSDGIVSGFDDSSKNNDNNGVDLFSGQPDLLSGQPDLLEASNQVAASAVDLSSTTTNIDSFGFDLSLSANVDWDFTSGNSNGFQSGDFATSDAQLDAFNWELSNSTSSYFESKTVSEAGADVSSETAVNLPQLSPSSSADGSSIEGLANEINISESSSGLNIGAISPSEESSNVTINFKVGDLIEGNYRGKGRWYKGKIVRVKELESIDGVLYDIDYDDRTKELRVSRDRIRYRDGFVPLSDAASQSPPLSSASSSSSLLESSTAVLQSTPSSLSTTIEVETASTPSSPKYQFDPNSDPQTESAVILENNDIVPSNSVAPALGSTSTVSATELTQSTPAIIEVVESKTSLVDKPTTKAAPAQPPAQLTISTSSSTADSKPSSPDTKSSNSSFADAIPFARMIPNIDVYSNLMPGKLKFTSDPHNDKVYPLIADVYLPYTLSSDFNSVSPQVLRAYTQVSQFSHNKLMKPFISNEAYAGSLCLPVAAPLPMTQEEIDQLDIDKANRRAQRQAKLEAKNRKEESFSFSISKNLWGEVASDQLYEVDEDEENNQYSEGSTASRDDAVSARFKRRSLLPYKVREIPPENGEETAFSGLILLKQPRLASLKSPQGNRSDVIATNKFSSRLHIVRLCESESPPIWSGNDDLQSCSICRHSFAYFRPGHHCRNCGYWICEHCSSKCWPSTMLPETYCDNEKIVRVCDSCVYLTESFADALRTGDFDRSIAIHDTGNINLRQPLDIYVTGEYPVHCAVLGGSLELVKWLIEDRLVPLSYTSNDGTSRKFTTKSGLTALAVAAKYGRHDIMLYLVQKGCTVDEITDRAVLINGLHAALLSPGPLPNMTYKKKGLSSLLSNSSGDDATERVIVNRDTSISRDASDSNDSETIDTLSAKLDSLPKARYINSHPRIGSFPHAGPVVVFGAPPPPITSPNSASNTKVAVGTSNPNIMLIERPLWIKDYKSVFDNHLKLSSKAPMMSGYKLASAIAEAAIQKELKNRQLMKENSIRLSVGAPLNRSTAGNLSSSNSNSSVGNARTNGNSSEIAAPNDLFHPTMYIPMALPFQEGEIMPLEKSQYYHSLLKLNKNKNIVKVDDSPRLAGKTRNRRSDADSTSHHSPSHSHSDSNNNNHFIGGGGGRVEVHESRSNPHRHGRHSNSPPSGLVGSQFDDDRNSSVLSMLRQAPSPPTGRSTASSSHHSSNDALATIAN